MLALRGRRVSSKALSEGEIAQIMDGITTAAVEATGKLSVTWAELKGNR